MTRCGSIDHFTMAGRSETNRFTRRMEQGDLSNLPQQPDLERTFQLDGYLRMYETEIKPYSVFYAMMMMSTEKVYALTECI